MLATNRRVSRLALAAALALLSAALAKAQLDPDIDPLVSPPPWNAIGNRYGRSSDRHIQTRGNGFAMWSRYGKRSRWSAPAGGWRGGAGRGEAPPLFCEYTGVMYLYRCFRTYGGQSNRREESRLRLREERHL